MQKYERTYWYVLTVVRFACVILRADIHIYIQYLTLTHIGTMTNHRGPTQFFHFKPKPFWQTCRPHLTHMERAWTLDEIKCCGQRVTKTEYVCVWLSVCVRCNLSLSPLLCCVCFVWMELPCFLKRDTVTGWSKATVFLFIRQSTLFQTDNNV